MRRAGTIPADPKLRQTTKTTTAHERRDAKPTAGKLTDPKEVWKDSETTPSEKRGGGKTGHGRVADAGDIAGADPQPYDVETQGDNVARQTNRDLPAGGSRKPTKTRQ